MPSVIGNDFNQTKTRITAKRVAEIIGCSEKTIYNGGAGTDGLTRIRNGRRQVRFILEEGIALVERQERQALKARDRYAKGAGPMGEVK
jgi:hypothetical protein